MHVRENLNGNCRDGAQHAAPTDSVLLGKTERLISERG